MKYLIEINTTKGWTVIAGFNVLPEAVDYLEQSDVLNVRVHDTIAGERFTYDEINLNSLDERGDADLKRLLDGASFIQTMSKAA